MHPDFLSVNSTAGHGYGTSLLQKFLISDPTKRNELLIQILLDTMTALPTYQAFSSGQIGKMQNSPMPLCFTPPKGMVA